MTYAINKSRAEWRVVDDEAVVVNVETSYYYGLNRAGTFVWTALSERARSVDELADELAAAFEVELSRAREDVETLLADLKREDLLVEV